MISSLIPNLTAGSAADLEPNDGRSSRAMRGWILAGVALAAVSMVRVFTGANDLTSSGAIGSAIRLGMPIMLAGLAGLWAERAGVVNIGIEGMMILGTWGGGFGAWKFGPWIGLVFAIVGGILGGLIHALATVTFNVDHIVSGVAINLLAEGFTRYLSAQYFVGQTGGSISQSPRQKSSIPTIDVPFLAGGKLFGWSTPDILGWLEHHRWWIIGDLAGLLGGLTRGISLLTILALVLTALTGWVLWRTRIGLWVRSSGEAPYAAASLGVPVRAVRYGALVMSGAFAGLGGGFLAIVSNSSYRQGLTGGRGYIGLATMIFGNWRPGGLLGGSMLFGYADALQLRSDSAVRALCLVIGVGALLAALRQLVRGLRAGTATEASTSAGSLRSRLVSIIGLGTVGIAFVLVYAFVKEIPAPFTTATPFVVTLIVLAAASQRLRMPAADGQPYFDDGQH